MRKRLAWIGLLLGMAPSAVLAQQRGLAGACAVVATHMDPSTCIVVEQALEAAQPQLGVLVTGGNPTLGTASTGGLRLGIIPKVSATAKANLLFGHLPDIRAVRTSPTDAQSFGTVRIFAPSLSGTVAIGVYPGVDLAPTVGGFGSVDLLGTASWLPFRSLASDRFRPSTADVAFGGGVRLGLLRESFTMPGASVSVMYSRTGDIRYGRVCPTGIVTSTTSGPGFTLDEGTCVPTDLGDLGEFGFDLRSWSTRAAVSKHLLGLGLTAGLGYDRHSSDVTVGFRSPAGTLQPPSGYFARVRDVTLKQGRWSGFVDGSVSLLLATLAVEAGWLQGADPVPGYPASTSEFDPNGGTFFGSLGLRIAF